MDNLNNILPDLIIEQTATSPKVYCDAQKGIANIEGKLIMLNAVECYENIQTPLLKWITKYFESINNSITVDFNVSTINADNQSALLTLFKKLEDINKNGNRINIHWHYGEEGDYIHEAGKDCSELSKIPFSLLAPIDKKPKYLNRKISILIGDIIRWIAAIILLPFIAWLLFLFFMYPFEWLLSKTTNWKWIVHVLFWILIGISIVKWTTVIGGVFSFLSTFLVRQSNTYIILMFLVFLALVGYCTYAAWSNNIIFSWEMYRYRTFNRSLYSFLLLNLLRIPINMFISRNE